MLIVKSKIRREEIELVDVHWEVNPGIAYFTYVIKMSLTKDMLDIMKNARKRHVERVLRQLTWKPKRKRK